MVAQLKSKAEFDACVNGTDKWALRAHPRTYITWRTPPLYTSALWRPELGGRLVFDLCAKGTIFFVWVASGKNAARCGMDETVAGEMAQFGTAQFRQRNPPKICARFWTNAPL